MPYLRFSRQSEREREREKKEKKERKWKHTLLERLDVLAGERDADAVGGSSGLEALLLGRRHVRLNEREREKKERERRGR